MLDVSSSASVDDLMSSIRSTEGIPVDRQRLVFSGSRLEGGRSLWEYHVRDESVIDLRIVVAGVTDITVDVVKKYAPVLKFHPDEKYFPCSIEHLMHGAVLKYRNFLLPTMINGLQPESPALTVFKGQLLVAYPNGSQFFVSRSSDGQSWEKPRSFSWPFKIKLSVLCVFQKQLCVVSSEAGFQQLWISTSEDGQTFSRPLKIPNQQSSALALAALGNKLVMVYRDSHRSQLWMSQTSDGVKWDPPERIQGQKAKAPALATFDGKIILVYTDPRNSNLCFSQYAGVGGWSAPIKISDKGPDMVALATIDDWLCMAYSHPSDSQLYVNRCRQVIGWQTARPILNQKGSKPMLAAFSDTLFLMYKDPKSSHLWLTQCFNGDIEEHEPIPNLTQKILSEHSSQYHYIEINPSQYPGQPLSTAPLYYAVQELGDKVRITYLFLYSYQGGQTVRAKRLIRPFDCMLFDLGTHQGDLERFSIFLQKRSDGSYHPYRVTFEAHGHPTDYDLNKVQWEEDTHAIVYVALNDHATRNQNPSTSNTIYDVVVPGFVAIGDYIGDGFTWRPHNDGTTFALVGLDSSGRPVDDQLWSLFAGQMGHAETNELRRVTYFDGKPLSFMDRIFVDIVYAGAKLLNKIPAANLLGNGPNGPEVRDWDRPGTEGIFPG
jgi:hypothetical protein